MAEGNRQIMEGSNRVPQTTPENGRRSRESKRKLLFHTRCVMIIRH